MLRLVHPPTVTYDVTSLVGFANEKPELDCLGRALLDPMTAEAIERFVEMVSSQQVRGGLVIVRHPSSGRLCGAFPLIATERSTPLSGEQPVVWRLSPEQPSIYLMRPRFIAEALDGLIRYLTESYWRSDVLVFESGSIRDDRLSDIRRYCRDGGVHAWRSEPHSGHEERLTLALSQLGACMVTGARWYDALRKRHESRCSRSGATASPYRSQGEASQLSHDGS